MAKFSQEFKVKSVKQALTRNSDQTLENVADDLGVGLSTLGKWIRLAKDNKLETSSHMGSKEKSPQNWDKTQRFEAIVMCDGQDEELVSSYCRKKGIYPHHIEQWKIDFLSENHSSEASSKNESKKLNQEIKALKLELNRKEKALSEAAALLMLSKKCHAIWGAQEG